MQRLIPAILEACREAERAFEAAAEPPRSELAERIHVLREAHGLAVREGAERETVVRFLQEHGAGAIVPETASG